MHAYIGLCVYVSVHVHIDPFSDCTIFLSDVTPTMVRPRVVHFFRAKVLDMVYMDTLPEPEKKSYMYHEKLEVLFKAKDPKSLCDPYEIESNE